MDKTTSFKVAADYRVPLLWIMAQLEQAHNANVLNEFERQFQQLIPPHHMGYQGKGKLKKWQDYVQWARQAFVNIGLMGSAGRGVWTITSEGKQWLDEHPDGGKHELNDVIKEHYFGPKPPKPPKPPKSPERTNSSNTAQHRILDERILEIRRLIEGRAMSRPDDQVLCFWVLFCYDFELYAEGAELFNLINPSSVEPSWLYQRAKKLAHVCGMKSASNQPDGETSNLQDNVPQEFNLNATTNYRLALLRVMAQLEQAQIADVFREFERQFEGLIPSHHKEYEERGNLKKWQKTLQWARQALVDIGFMGSAGRGVWTITNEGKQWLDEHPDGGQRELNDLIQHA